MLRVCRLHSFRLGTAMRNGHDPWRHLFQLRRFFGPYWTRHLVMHNSNSGRCISAAPTRHIRAAVALSSKSLASASSNRYKSLGGSRSRLSIMYHITEVIYVLA